MNILPYMIREGEQHYVTESYVSVPPALIITDERGAIWTLGNTTAPKWQAPDGEFAFDVLRNGVDTGEVASRIERRNGRVRIFTRDGWKIMNTNVPLGTPIGSLVHEIVADMHGDEYQDCVVNVSVYCDHAPLPELIFFFNCRNGGGWKAGIGCPLVVTAGQWLHARIEPPWLAPHILVQALFNGGVKREIPVVK